MSYPTPVLEPAAAESAAATANPPYLFDLGPEAGRKTVDEVQSGEIPKPDVSEEWVTVPAPTGDVRVRIVTPPNATGPGAAGPLPVIIYIHGAGWVFGDAHTHDRLVRELLPVSLGMVMYEAEPAVIEMIVAGMPAEVRPAFPQAANEAYVAYAQRLHGPSLARTRR
jgi:hypothetical protein